MFREKDKDDLRNEILSLKVQLNNAKNENCLLKVKVRKLQEEIVKKNKHVEVLLNPKKSSAFRKVLSENGAAVVMTSLERNLKLQKLLDERNAQIKKLQSELETARLYTVKKRPTSCKSITETEKMKINMPVKSLTFSNEISNKVVQKSNSLTASLEGHCAYNANNETAATYCPRNSGSPESDLDRNELFCETPHKEIQQLHKYMIDVLSEVDTLKETIAQIQEERKKTDGMLLERKESIDEDSQKRRKGVKNATLKQTKESSNKRAVIKSPRKIKVKKKSKKNRANGRKDGVQILSSCIDSIETQIQRESSCTDSESESDNNS